MAGRGFFMGLVVAIRIAITWILEKNRFELGIGGAQSSA
jgi:hypothetical protein